MFLVGPRPEAYYILPFKQTTNPSLHGPPYFCLICTYRHATSHTCTAHNHAQRQQLQMIIAACTKAAFLLYKSRHKEPCKLVLQSTSQVINGSSSFLLCLSVTSPRPLECHVASSFLVQQKRHEPRHGNVRGLDCMAIYSAPKLLQLLIQPTRCRTLLTSSSPHLLLRPATLRTS